MTPPRGALRLHLLAGSAYLAAVLFVLRAVWPDPSLLLPQPAMLVHRDKLQALALDRRDQGMVVATVTRNAALLSRAPTRLLDDAGQCHPMPRAHTLGEHMFGLGLLAALPYALTADPIASFNAALAVSWWIAAVAMYAFLFHYTRSPGAAFAGGLAFLLVPARIANPAHPYVHADIWTPLVLLFLHRCFARRGWGDALGLGVFTSLQMTESLYPVLVCAQYGALFAIQLAFRHRDRLLSVGTRLALASLPVLATAAVVLGPYLATRAAWGTLGDRPSIFLNLRELAPGSFYFVGWTVAALAAIGLLDRIRRPIPDDPRWPLVLGIVLVAWGALGRVHPFGSTLPSPFVALRGIVPGLDAVRAMRATVSGVDVGFAGLVGFGTWALARGRPRSARMAIAALACLAIWAPASYGPLSRSTFGDLLRLDAYPARPPLEDIALLRREARGALLDLPLPHASGKMLPYRAGPNLLLASYSPRPTATCYNSFFAGATTGEVARHAEALPDPDAASALAALGFGTVLVHEEPGPASILGAWMARLGGGGPLALAGRTDRLALYHLPTPPPAQGDFRSLAPAEPLSLLRVTAPRAIVELPVTNRGDSFFRHPEPTVPSELELRWRPRDGGAVEVTRVRALLPLALAPGRVAPVRVDTATPSRPGRYLLELRLASSSDGPPLAAADVEIAAASGSPAAAPNGSRAALSMVAWSGCRCG